MTVRLKDGSRISCFGPLKLKGGIDKKGSGGKKRIEPSGSPKGGQRHEKLNYRSDGFE